MSRLAELSAPSRSVPSSSSSSESSSSYSRGRFSLGALARLVLGVPAPEAGRARGAVQVVAPADLQLEHGDRARTGTPTGSWRAAAATAAAAPAAARRRPHGVLRRRGRRWCRGRGTAAAAAGRVGQGVTPHRVAGGLGRVRIVVAVVVHGSIFVTYATTNTDTRCAHLSDGRCSILSAPEAARWPRAPWRFGRRAPPGPSGRRASAST